MERNKLKILGVAVDKVDRKGAMAAYKELLAREGCDLIVTPNSEIVVRAGEDPELFRILEEAALVIPDGIGLVYASRILKDPLTERVTGVDFLSDILEDATREGYGVYILGSKPGTADAAAEAMKKAYPGLIISGTHHGYFKPEEEAAIAEEIGRSGAKFLCVALGAPKQEKFVEQHKKALGVSCAMGVGGSLDVWAGNVKRAPEFYQKHGLEWLYRLLQEPSRIGRMMALPVFMLRVLFGKKEK